MGRAPCCEKNGVKKGPWTPEEDGKLIDYIQQNGYGNWRTLPKNAGLQRCGKSCRLRWTNYLRPDIKRGRFSLEEEEAIIQLHSILGNKWSAIAARLPGRTDNEIKNYWNTNIKKRLLRMGIDPVTHTPRLDLLDLSSILNSSLYSNSLSRLSGIQSLANPEFLRLAYSIFSSKPQNQDYLIQNQLITNHNPGLFPGSFQTCEMQNPVQDLTIPTPSAVDHLRNHDEGVQHFPQNLAGFGLENYGYYGSDQTLGDPTPLLETSNLKSVSSSPTLYSYSIYNYANSSTTEDERENSYGSNGLKFEIPDLWDVNDFM